MSTQPSVPELKSAETTRSIVAEEKLQQQSIKKKIYKCIGHGKKIKTFCWACKAYQCSVELTDGTCPHKKDRFDPDKFEAQVARASDVFENTIKSLTEILKKLTLENSKEYFDPNVLRDCIIETERQLFTSAPNFQSKQFEVHPISNDLMMSAIINNFDDLQFLIDQTIKIDVVPYQRICTVKGDNFSTMQIHNAWQTVSSGFIIIIKAKDNQVFGGVVYQHFSHLNDSTTCYEYNTKCVIFNITKRKSYYNPQNEIIFHHSITKGIKFGQIKTPALKLWEEQPKKQSLTTSIDPTFPGLNEPLSGSEEFTIDQLEMYIDLEYPLIF